ncbi:hypothetical protein KDW82_32240, partial [Burkholderia vietnamiensis]|uniref:hypothetical protein n=1 Tax=Burkholderia vietnamiensis TaxID=60552 RepID=UPI001B90B91C
DVYKRQRPHAASAGAVEAGATPAAPTSRAAHRRLRNTLHALVGLRLSLYPAAAAQPPQATADGARA